MGATVESVRNALTAVKDPDLKRDLIALGWLKVVAVDAAGKVKLKLELASPADPMKETFIAECKRVAGAVASVSAVEIESTWKVTASRLDPGGIAPGVKNLIAVGSGKGGVGKSTVAANLAVALAQSGASVGLLDADVYGPSVPTIMGVTEKPAMQGESLAPIAAHGVALMSIGFLIDPEQPVVWRGPMVHKMIQTFLGQVSWGALDYLIIDMPPGTGDIQLTICQTVPLTGAIVVSTPQQVALADAIKCIYTFRQMNAHLFGVVENMSTFICDKCDAHHDIFGAGGAEAMAERLDLNFLGAIPLETLTRIDSDAGSPVVMAHPDSATARAFRAVAGRLARRVLVRNLSSPIPIKLSVS